MANDDQDLELDVGADKVDKSGGKGKLIIIIVVAVLLIGGGGAAFMLLGGDDEAAAEVSDGDAEGNAEDGSSENKDEIKGPAIYVGVPEAIVSNIPGVGRSHTVQIKMSFLVRSEDAKNNVKTHMPQLKNDVLMLVSQQTAEELKTPEGREKLQTQSLEVVQKTLTELVGAPTVERVLFISFVMQR